jgi:L-histidine Nalpha-methyltransferase / hercynylcysteine S-oxide synthase
LDLSLPELNRTFAELDTNAFHYVKFHALHGTYDDGLSWLAKSSAEGRVTCVMQLGSSIGNFTRPGAVGFLKSFKEVLTASDLMLVGVDACQQPSRVFHAYNDKSGVTQQFYRNGLVHANRILGYEAFKADDWDIEGLYDETAGKHQASYVAKTSVKGKDFSFQAGEKIHLEDAFKYSQSQSDALWHGAGLIPQLACSNKAGDYSKAATKDYTWRY